MLLVCAALQLTVSMLWLQGKAAAPNQQLRRPVLLRQLQQGPSLAEPAASGFARDGPCRLGITFCRARSLGNTVPTRKLRLMTCMTEKACVDNSRGRDGEMTLHRG